MNKSTYDKMQVNLVDRIIINPRVPKEDILTTHKQEEIKLTQITQKLLYEETIMTQQRDHHSQEKWVLKLDTSIMWEEVWDTVHNILSTNKVKSLIWQQIHLNFYTQYSYNKWHKKQDLCPLCQKNPENIYHIMLYCEYTNKLWGAIEPILRELHPPVVTEEEKVFGIIRKPRTTGILLRNWVTFLLRYCISQAERLAYHTQKKLPLEYVERKLYYELGMEVHIKYIQSKNDGKLENFDKIVTHSEFCKKRENGEYTLRQLFT